MSFENYPKLNYDFTLKTEANQVIEEVTDLSTKIGLGAEMTNQDVENMCHRYTVSQGELPEHISYNFYSTPDLAWTILYINNIGNLATDWPLSDMAISEYTAEKYGAGNVDAIHHSEKLPENIIMDRNFIIANYGLNAVYDVTNLEHEIALNERKRMLYVIKPENISLFTTQFQRALK